MPGEFVKLHTESSDEPGCFMIGCGIIFWLGVIIGILGVCSEM